MQDPSGAPSPKVGEGGWRGVEGGGKGFFSKSMVFFYYFRHNKSEPDLTDDCIVTVFFGFSSKSVSPRNRTS